jgi:hypothetical protein
MGLITIYSREGLPSTREELLGEEERSLAPMGELTFSPFLSYPR